MADSHQLSQSQPIESMWETAFIYAYCCTFAHLLKDLPEFTPQDLEIALNDTTGNRSQLLESLHCVFLTTLLNRKKPVEYSSWHRILSETIDTKLRAGEIDLRYNPFKAIHDYFSWEPFVKLRVLKALVEWQLTDSSAVRDLIEQYYSKTDAARRREGPNPLEVTPFGCDSKKRTYWNFGNSARLWREKPYTKKASTSNWESVTTTLEELKVFAHTLKDSTSRVEKQLCTRIEDELIPRVEATELRRERAERTRGRLLALHLNNEVRETRTRATRKPVKYNFDDEDEDEFLEYQDGYEDDEGESESSRSTKRSSSRMEERKPTRISARVRGQAVTPSYESGAGVSGEEDERMIMSEDEVGRSSNGNGNGNGNGIYINDRDSRTASESSFRWKGDSPSLLSQGDDNKPEYLASGDEDLGNSDLAVKRRKVNGAREPTEGGNGHGAEVGENGSGAEVGGNGSGAEIDGNGEFQDDDGTGSGSASASTKGKAKEVENEVFGDSSDDDALSDAGSAFEPNATEDEEGDGSKYGS